MSRHNTDSLIIQSVKSTGRPYNKRLIFSNAIDVKCTDTEVRVGMKHLPYTPMEAVSYISYGELVEHVRQVSNTQIISNEKCKLTVEGCIPEKNDRILITRSGKLNGVYVVHHGGSERDFYVLNKTNEVPEIGSTVYVRSCRKTYVKNHNDEWVILHSDNVQEINNISKGNSLISSHNDGSVNLKGVSAGEHVKVSDNLNDITVSVLPNTIDINTLNGFDEFSSTLAHLSEEVGDNVVWSSEKMLQELSEKSNVEHSHTVSDIQDLEHAIRNHPDVMEVKSIVSADGSVTTHSDVFDAGSGKIITEAERSKLAKIPENACGKMSADEIVSAFESLKGTCYFDQSDREKLDSIDYGATCEITAPRVSELYESNDDCNRFSNELLAKLNSIEAGAKREMSAHRVSQLYESNENCNRLTDELLAKLNELSGTNTGDEPIATENLYGTVRFATCEEIKNGTGNGVLTPSTFSIGKPNGIAQLDHEGLIPNKQIPIINHSALGNRNQDDHRQYLNINGRQSGQIAYGGTTSGETLSLSGSKAGNGSVIICGNNDALTSNSGSLIVEGGAGICKNLCVGANLSVKHNARVSGNLEVSGTVNGLNLNSSINNLMNLSERLGNLSNHEVSQLENINNVNISESSWRNVSKLNQNVSTTSDVNFNCVTAKIKEPEQPIINHGSLANLKSDSHPQYLNVDGRTSGQTVHGSTEINGTLTLRGSSYKTSGPVNVDSDLKVSGTTHLRDTTVKGLFSVSGINVGYGSAVVHEGKFINIPADCGAFEITGGNVKWCETVGPKDISAGRVIMIYNDSDTNVSGDFKIPSKTGASFFYTGSKWRKC